MAERANSPSNSSSTVRFVKWLNRHGNPRRDGGLALHFRWAGFRRPRASRTVGGSATPAGCAGRSLGALLAAARLGRERPQRNKKYPGCETRRDTGRSEQASAGRGAGGWGVRRALRHPNSARTDRCKAHLAAPWQIAPHKFASRRRANVARRPTRLSRQPLRGGRSRPMTVTTGAHAYWRRLRGEFSRCATTGMTRRIAAHSILTGSVWASR